MFVGGKRIGTLLAVALTLQTALAATLLVPGAAAQPSPQPYHNYETMKEDVRALAEEHSEIARFQVHGESTLGNELFHVDVANDIENRSDDELAELPTLYVDGLHHGNEILSGEAAYFFLERVLTNASEDPSYLEGKRLVVNPVMNADGFIRDQRENMNGVDLNRNYPHHWGLYGTSEIPFTGNYRGSQPASETETQANIELMESLNMVGYLTGHTGTYDIVLPWRQSEDGEIPDWPLYEKTLGIIENETGLEYRDPSGAGEAHAWGYGNRTAFGILPEVSTEQFNPASTGDVETRLNEVLQVYRITWENLTHIGGELHYQGMEDGNLTLHNDGWGPAYNVTLDVETDVMAPEDNASANDTVLPPRLDEIGSGETATLPYVDGAQAVHYERVTIPGDDPQLKAKTLALPAGLNGTETEPAGDDDLLGVPSPGFAIVAAMVALTALVARRRARP